MSELQKEADRIQKNLLCMWTWRNRGVLRPVPDQEVVDTWEMLAYSNTEGKTEEWLEEYIRIGGQLFNLLDPRETANDNNSVGICVNK